MNDPLEPSPTEPPSTKSCLAVFDFDATLAKGDSLWPFLQKAVGKITCYKAAINAVIAAYSSAKCVDRKTKFKTVLLEKTLKGRSIESLAFAIKDMETYPEWLETIEELKRHYKAGHRILIATGALDLYIESMLKDIPYNDILCTRMEVKNGILTGRIENGNCVRGKKAELVKTYIEKHGPYSESWGYGNEPSDLPMMAILDRGIVIEKE